MDREIRALAERRHGIVTRRQLLELGMTKEAIAGRLERGLLHSAHRGVYIVGPRLPTDMGRWLATTDACGPGAYLSHRSAARFWGLLRSEPRDVEVIVGLARVRPGIVTRRIALRDDEVEVIDEIPVTCAARTVFDLAGVVRERELERAWNEMEVRQLSSRVSVPLLLERYPRRPGAAALRRLLSSEEPGGVARNEFEEAFVDLLDAHGLPRPEKNADLWLGGRFVEVDCLWRAERLAVELDGRAVHARRAAFESDKRRDRELLAAGWRTGHVTWRQLQDEPEAVAADLRATLLAGA
ncbi:MAG: type IV toxin-antitoxin system AbiEi family antitoxin domain-containing protein [Solirubrobacterales bacterium]